MGPTSAMFQPTAMPTLMPPIRSITVRSNVRTTREPIDKCPLWGAATTRFRGSAVTRKAPIPTGMRSRAWWVYLLSMTPVVGLYLFGPAPINSGPVFNTIGLSAVAAIVVGVRLQRPRNPLAWYLFASGQALFGGGDVLAYNYGRFFGRSLP